MSVKSTVNLIGYFRRFVQFGGTHLNAIGSMCVGMVEVLEVVVVVEVVEVVVVVVVVMAVWIRMVLLVLQENRETTLARRV